MRDDDDDDCGEIVGMRIGRGNRGTWRKPVPVPHITAYKPYFLRLASSSVNGLRRAADKSLAFPIPCFPICSTTKRIFLGWVEEVRTTKS
jgi:hypothetical protein